MFMRPYDKSAIIIEILLFLIHVADVSENRLPET